MGKLDSTMDEGKEGAVKNVKILFFRLKHRVDFDAWKVLGWGVLFLMALSLLSLPAVNYFDPIGFINHASKDQPTLIRHAVSRIVGNNMWPLQAVDQFRRNLVTIVNEEADRFTLLADVESVVFRGTKFTGVPRRMQCCTVKMGVTMRFHISFVYNEDESGTLRFVERYQRGTKNFFFEEGRGGWRIDGETKRSPNPTEEDVHILSSNHTSWKLTSFRSWTINRVLNVTELKRTEEYLKRRGQIINREKQSFTHLTRDAAASDENLALLYLTNQNAARNFVSDDLSLLGSKWISPLDGNVVVTEEGFLNLGLSLILAEQTKVQFHFLPMYRLVPSDNTIVQRDKKFAELLPSIQRHEAQVSFRYDAPLSYSVGLEYGKRNKFDLMLQLADRYKYPSHCLDGFGTTKSSNEQGIAGVEYCGMSVRLPWWTPSTIAFRTEFSMPRQRRRAVL
eukprot:GHVN01005432.1.p1 GENE.GHVN01005432.1~~GHVN01005432.1.p1  ORF type:complete len:450 (-),score=35.23 GHVN01005432.1:690-2039(-)